MRTQRLLEILPSDIDSKIISIYITTCNTVLTADFEPQPQRVESCEDSYYRALEYLVEEVDARSGTLGDKSDEDRKLTEDMVSDVLVRALWSLSNMYTEKAVAEAALSYTKVSELVQLGETAIMFMRPASNKKLQEEILATLSKIIGHNNDQNLVNCFAKNQTTCNVSACETTFMEDCDLSLVRRIFKLCFEPLKQNFANDFNPNLFRPLLSLLQTLVEACEIFATLFQQLGG